MEATRELDIAITGSTGLIGSALAVALRAGGHRVRSIVRRAAGAPDEISIDRLDLTGVDAIVNLGGEGIADKRWNDEQKRRIIDSRREGTRRIAEAIASTDRKPVLLSGSAIGYYGNRGDEILTEETGPGPSGRLSGRPGPSGRPSGRPGSDFLTDVCLAWEAAAQPAIDAGARVAFLRTGIVLAPHGGALGKLLPLFKLGLGGRMGSGRQWMSWITLDDEVAAITHLLTAEVSGPVNLTAPNPVTNAELGKTLGRVLHRPSVLPTPAFGPRLLLGRELAASLLFDSQRVLPARLVESGFAHEHPQLEGALRDMLNR